MNTLTHALLPVIGVSVNKKRTDKCGAAYWGWKRLFLLCFFGALPDLLHPHLSLSARYTSYSHGLPALFCVGLLLGILVQVKKFGLDLYLVAWIFLAYALHLLCDLVSGGIAWCYPFDSSVIGGYYFPVVYWIPLDFICALTVYFIYRAIPKYVQAKQKKDGGSIISNKK